MIKAFQARFSKKLRAGAGEMQPLKFIDRAMVALTSMMSKL
jgi:hypothetical protein